HGEARTTWPASDALCSALQVLNHLQDCVADYRALDRVYLPERMLEASGARIDELAAGASSPAMRRLLDHLLDGTDALILGARSLPKQVAARGLARECGVIVSLAEYLARRLRRGDPLARRVKLTPIDFARALLKGFWRGRR
ncbi:MAG TPA: squalene/phytoene synthase family protein, partial [Stellaceae bacterium]|nr:squalene/phytoene synthase family protein [Stellaceae bacterium]